MPTKDPESAAIIAGWQEYWRVIDKYRSHPLGYTDFSELNLVTTGEGSKIAHRGISHLREMKARPTGRISLRDVTLGTVQPANEAFEGLPTATVTYCIDRTHNAGVDQNGKRLDWPTTPLIETATMVKGHDGVWRLGMLRNKAGKCKG